MSSLIPVESWHARACPAPNDAAINTQIGVHVEEFGELLAALAGTDPGSEWLLHQVRQMVDLLAENLKAGVTTVQVADRRGALDALADGIVTAVGVGYRASMNVPKAVEVVDTSNWTKYDETGRPIFNANGKVAKGPGYVPPDLTGLY